MDTFPTGSPPDRPADTGAEAAFRAGRPPLAEPAFRASLGERLGRLGRLVRKELLEILRDRRTIITLILMPVLLYPLLSIAFQQFFVASRLSVDSEVELKLGVKTFEEFEWVEAILRRGAQLVQQRDRPVMERPPPPPTYHKYYSGLDLEHLESAVRNGVVHLGIRVKDLARQQAAWAEGREVSADCELIFNLDSPTSRLALDYVERRLAAFNASELSRRMGKASPQRGLWSLQPARVAVAEPGAAAPVSLAALVPLILILMTITGAVYPAIDLTAGERERGTLEILVAAPVPRLGLLFAKYVSVVTVAVLTALINLIMMTLTLVFSGLGPVIFRGQGLSLEIILQLFGLLLLFAAFFSAVLLILTSRARSFKEAQAYLIPLMVVSLAPGLIGMLPGLKLEGLLAVAPLLNIVLLGRDLFEGGVDPAMAAVVVVSTFLYALAAIAAAARIFGAESVLYSEQTSWGDLFRRAREPRAVPSVTAALLCLALMFPAWILLAWLIRVTDPPDRVRPLLVPLMSVLLFLGLPLLSAFYSRVRPATGFFWHKVSLPLLAGGIILGLSLWPLILQLLLLQLGGPKANLERFQELVGLVTAAQQVPLDVLLMVVVVPALVEEMFFRGYLFSALRAHSGPFVTIVASAVLFGFFHLITQGFGFQRLLPSTLMGLVLGWVAWQSGSVIPGMLLHGLHNALLQIVSRSQGGLPTAWHTAAGGAAGAAVPLEEPLLPLAWIAAGVAGVVIGSALIFWFRRPRPTEAIDGPQASPKEPLAAP